MADSKDTYHSVTPYLLVADADAEIAFLKSAFGGTEANCQRNPDNTVMHAEIKIGDSLVMLGQAGGPHKPRPAALYLWVEDVDATYARALQAGAKTSRTDIETPASSIRTVSRGGLELPSNRTVAEEVAGKETRDMNIVVWLLQILLAVAFLAHGLLFLFPPADMIPLMDASIAPPFRLFIGAAEVLAAIGLTLPGLTRVLPWLIPWAAAGLMIVMIGATIFHVARNEVASALTTAVLFVLATFVAYMRWKVLPIRSRMAH